MANAVRTSAFNRNRVSQPRPTETRPRGPNHRNTHTQICGYWKGLALADIMYVFTMISAKDHQLERRCNVQRLASHRATNGSKLQRLLARSAQCQSHSKATFHEESYTVGSQTSELKAFAVKGYSTPVMHRS